MKCRARSGRGRAVIEALRENRALVAACVIAFISISSTLVLTTHAARAQMNPNHSSALTYPGVLLIGPGAFPHLSCASIMVSARRLSLGSCVELQLEGFDSEFRHNPTQALTISSSEVERALAGPVSIGILIACSRGAGIVGEAARILPAGFSVLLLSPILNGGGSVPVDDYRQMLALLHGVGATLTMATGDSSDEIVLIADGIRAAIDELGPSVANSMLITKHGDHAWYSDADALGDLILLSQRHLRSETDECLPEP